MKKDKHINIYVTDKTLQLLQEYAQDHRWTLSAAAGAILEDFLKEKEKKRPAPAEPAREPDA